MVPPVSDAVWRCISLSARLTKIASKGGLPMARRSFPLSKVYGLLEPGPVVLLSTAHKGKANVMTMSWHTMMEFEPPLVGCIVSGRDFSFAALKATRQCVLA